MGVSAEIKQKLQEGLSPAKLDITNESHKHVGHAGHDGSGESHFRVEIVSDAFEGKSRVERQRMVFDLLQNEMGRIHALSLQTYTQTEKNQK